MTPLAPAGVPALVERLRAAHLVWRGVPLDRRVMLLDRASGLWLDDREREIPDAPAVEGKYVYYVPETRSGLAVLAVKGDTVDLHGLPAKVVKVGVGQFKFVWEGYACILN
ncbi:MAG: hypothetical protein WCH13_18450, partial [Deltaproteobacteria bacterium]